MTDRPRSPFPGSREPDQPAPDALDSRSNGEPVGSRQVQNRSRTDPEQRAVVAAPAALPAAPTDPLADEWTKRTARAVKVIDKGIDLEQPLGMEPDEYRARLAAADRVLGFRRGGLPLPTHQALRLGEVTVKDGDKIIRLRWADGRPVVLPLHDPMKREASPDGDDD